MNSDNEWESYHPFGYPSIEEINAQIYKARGIRIYCYRSDNPILGYALAMPVDTDMMNLAWHYFKSELNMIEVSLDGVDWGWEFAVVNPAPKRAISFAMFD